MVGRHGIGVMDAMAMWEAGINAARMEGWCRLKMLKMYRPQAPGFANKAEELMAYTDK